MINFPFKRLKEVDIDGDTDEQGEGGGSSTSLTKLDTIKNFVNIIYNDYNVKFDIVEETFTDDIKVRDEYGDKIVEVITSPIKFYKFVPKTNIPRVYLTENNNNGSITKGNYAGLNLYSCNIYKNESSISKIIFNDTELTVQQLKNYDIIQIGTSDIRINYPSETINNDEEYFDWFRNNTREIATIPILLLGQPNTSDLTRSYYSFGFINTELFINFDLGIYSQAINGVIEESQL